MDASSVSLGVVGLNEFLLVPCLVGVMYRAELSATAEY
jgi:hypothetical protein